MITILQNIVIGAVLAPTIVAILAMLEKVFISLFFKKKTSRTD